MAKAKPYKVAYLSIMCYDAIGGIHHYGQICFKYKRGKGLVGKEHDDIYISQVITPKIARELNKEERRRGDPANYRVGSETTKFVDEASCIARAIAILKEKYPEYTVLLKGDPITLDPQPVLMAPEPLFKRLSKLVADAEKNNWWEGDEAKMEEIFFEWRKELRL